LPTQGGTRTQDPTNLRYPLNPSSHFRPKQNAEEDELDLKPVTKKGEEGEGEDFELPEFSNEQEEEAFAEKLAARYDIGELETLNNLATPESRWAEMTMQALMLIDEYGLGSDSDNSDKGKAKK